MDSPKGGFTHSRYQLQKSSQIREYKVLSASLSRNSRKSWSMVVRASRSRLSSHWMAKWFSAPPEATADAAPEVGASRLSHIFTSFNAFQSLLLKFRPCSKARPHRKAESLPAGEAIHDPKPDGIGSIFLHDQPEAVSPVKCPDSCSSCVPCLSRTIPVK